MVVPVKQGVITDKLVAKDDHKEAKKLFDSLSRHEREIIMDDLVLGVEIDWLYYDIDDDEPSAGFRRELIRLIEEYDHGL